MKWFLLVLVLLAGCAVPHDFVAVRTLNGSAEALLVDVSGVIGYDTATLAPGEYRDAEGEVGTGFFVWVRAADLTQRMWTFDVPVVDFTFVIPPRANW